METITQKFSLLPSKSPPVDRTNRADRKYNCKSRFPSSPRSQQHRDSSPRISRTVRATATSHYSLRKLHGSANKEIIKRALTPPARRLTLRWLDFKPTPSRLCNMSAAQFWYVIATWIQDVNCDVQKIPNESEFHLFILFIDDCELSKIASHFSFGNSGLNCVNLI